MSAEKNILRTGNTWVEAEQNILSFGYADVHTGGGKEWNREVAEKLTKKCNRLVVFTGPSPGYNEEGSTYRFMVQANTNREAAILLSQTDD